jgi:hypothetical protein
MINPTEKQIHQLISDLTTDEDIDCVLSLFRVVRNRDEISMKRFINALRNNFGYIIKQESFYFNMEYDVSSYRKNMSIHSMRYNLALLLEVEFGKLNIEFDSVNRILKKAN